MIKTAKRNPHAIPGSTLTRSQQHGLRVLEENSENLFLTGAPGTGKSYLISKFMQGQSSQVPVIASTGAAAILVGGRTFHSFFGLGIMQGGLERTLEKAVKNGRLKKRIREAHTLIIDEVSMLSVEAFDCAERIARFFRISEAPWGGIRMIVVGDFAQLPPVSRERKKDWCFMSKAWRRSNFKTVVLKEVKRTHERKFLEILEDIRWGRVSERVEGFLNERVALEEEVDKNVPHIFPRRAQTDAFNRARLNEIERPLKKYATEYRGADRYIEALKRDAPVPAVLELKEDALVMLRVNDPKKRYVNGTVGVISAMEDERLLVHINGRDIEVGMFTFTMLDADGEEAAYAMNFPVSLAYGSTIHKIQGTTLERLHVDLRHLWEPGQAYVALSRARSAKGLSLVGWNPASIIADPQVFDFYHPQPSEEESCLTSISS